LSYLNENAVQSDLNNKETIHSKKDESRGKLQLFRTVFSMMFNPSKAIKDAVHGSRWYYGMVVSSLAFGLFFVQTGLDLWKTGQKGMGFVFLSLLIGLGYGIVVIPGISLVAWLFLKLFKSPKEIKWTVASFCLSYSGALVYGFLGLIFSLIFQWKTAIAFGVSGVLWAIGPMIITVREMTEGKVALSVPVATVYAALVLLSWAYFGQL
jgi:hypothetical protein